MPKQKRRLQFICHYSALEHWWVEPTEYLLVIKTTNLMLFAIVSSRKYMNLAEGQRRRRIHLQHLDALAHKSQSSN